MESSGDDPSIESYIEAGDFTGLVDHCEEAEIMAPQGVSSAEIYGSLLAVYLLQNELDHAKLLWKRIPQTVKASNPEVGQVWEIGKRLWRRQFTEVYQLIELPTWPSHIAPILACLAEQVRSRVLGLVSRAYTDISLAELTSLLGLSEDRVVAVSVDKGWTVDNSTRIVSPQPIASVATDQDSKDDSSRQLARLVDIVSFLENN